MPLKTILDVTQSYIKILLVKNICKEVSEGIRDEMVKGIKDEDKETFIKHFNTCSKKVIENYLNTK